MFAGVLGTEVGYYEVGNFRYNNKWDAMIHATMLNCDYTWDFAPEIFSTFDWTKPIELSLDELALTPSLAEVVPVVPVSLSPSIEEDEDMEEEVEEEDEDEE